MRCLYCGKQLALFRRLTGSGEFCSDAHKQSYHEEYNRLALTRLIAAQTKSEEMKVALKSPSTAPFAARDRQQGRALEEAGVPASNRRWAGSAEPPKVLQAPPVEHPPATSASFFLTRPEPAEAAVPRPAAADFHELRVRPEVAPASWTPSIAEDIVVPPQAGLLESTTIPIPAVSLPGNIDIHSAGAVFPVAEPTLGIVVPIRPIAGLQPRPPVAIDFMEFAPKPHSKPVSWLKFEDFRFAVMVFGMPPLDVLPEGLEFEPPPKAAEVAAATPEVPEISRQPEPPQSRTAVAESARREDTGAKSEKVGPKLPTIPVARRKVTPTIPSIVQQPAEPAPEPSKSLWGALRDYMKR